MLPCHWGAREKWQARVDSDPPLVQEKRCVKGFSSEQEVYLPTVGEDSRPGSHSWYRADRTKHCEDLGQIRKITLLGRVMLGAKKSGDVNGHCLHMAELCLQH